MCPTRTHAHTYTYTHAHTHTRTRAYTQPHLFTLLPRLSRASGGPCSRACEVGRALDAARGRALADAHAGDHRAVCVAQARVQPAAHARVHGRTTLAPPLREAGTSRAGVVPTGQGFGGCFFQGDEGAWGGRSVSTNKGSRVTLIALRLTRREKAVHDNKEQQLVTFVLPDANVKVHEPSRVFPR
eukprot:5275023-Pleurochrysis_carterae.AAC.1